MKNNLPLPAEKKLMVLFRLEAGCLGPDGKDHIDKFIDLCIPKGIEELYKKQRYLEVMNIFIQNKENYLSSINKPME